LNIDRDGRVISWGNSFHPGSAPSAGLAKGSSGETIRVCESLRSALEVHRGELEALGGAVSGPWGLVKAALQVVTGGSDEVKVDEHVKGKIHQKMKHLHNHLHALCHGENAHVESDEERFMSPVEALIALLPRVSPEPSTLTPINPTELRVTPEHSLAPKAAPAEPPTQRISGPALASAGVVNDVPARLMYTQTSSGEPRLVWKLDVEMKDSWYEAYVDTTTGELLRIVDWASDYSWDTPAKGNKVKESKGGKQKPLPAPPTKLEPYTYQVFPWGRLLHHCL
jgi:extracellular elastinolytic metalloproteinase